MITISVANQKGGVGKTASLVNIALLLQEQNKRVLFVDNDPQGNASSSLKKTEGVTLSKIESTSLYEDDFSTIPEDIGPGEILLLPASRDLSQVSGYHNDRVVNLSNSLLNYEDYFDYCLIDNSPTLSLSLLASLVASDYVYTPVELKGFSIEGLVGVIQTVNGISQNLNEDLTFIGFLPSRVSKRSVNQRNALASLIKKWPDYLLSNGIVERDSINEALELGIPVWKLKKSAARDAAKEMRNACLSIITRIEDHENE